MAYGSILGQTVDIPDIPTTASQISYNNGSTSSIITSNNVQGAIDQLFTSVSNGKSQIASAITDKGVSTSANASFAAMAANIAAISVGKQLEISIVSSSSSTSTYFFIPNYTEDCEFIIAAYQTDNDFNSSYVASVFRLNDYGLHATAMGPWPNNNVQIEEVSCSISEHGRVFCANNRFVASDYLCIVIK